MIIILILFFVLLLPFPSSSSPLVQPPLAQSSSSSSTPSHPQPSDFSIPSSPSDSSSSSLIPDPDCGFLRQLLCYPPFSAACPPASQSGGYPYAGWIITSPTSSSSITVVESGRGRQCTDRSVRCAEFAGLCPDPIYRLFMYSHCPHTCGHCGDIGIGTTTISATKSTVGPWGTVKGTTVGRRSRVRAPTKRRGGNGDGEGGQQQNNTTRKGGEVKRNGTEWGWWATTTTTTTTTTTASSIRTTARMDGKKTTEKKKLEAEKTTTRKMGTTEDGGGTPSRTTVRMTATTEEGRPDEECEDVGQSCAAMERMCGDIGQRDIMGSFCRKTCNFC